MTNILRFYFSIIGLNFLLISAATLSFAQVDPTKALIGTWEGQVEITKNRERTLVINSVKPTGSGEWVARGRFGSSGQVETEKGGGQEMNVSSKDNEIFIEFVGTQGKAPVRVKLVGDNKLEGTIEAFERGKVAPRRITFEKVVPKAGDVK